MEFFIAGLITVTTFLGLEKAIHSVLARLLAAFIVGQVGLVVVQGVGQSIITQILGVPAGLILGVVVGFGGWMGYLWLRHRKESSRFNPF